ncbi:MAG: alginate lyase family protein [Kiritimatiellae bacterium]|nr:alginate lyase family protein [Kiritimatiellia bacterium]
MKEIIERLRRYAGAALNSDPPEIRPVDPEAEWGVDEAARAVLGLLLEGEGPGERLFEAADYLLTFYRGRARPEANTVLLNGTALALCGYCCHGKHPEAELWRVAGCARLATEVHRLKAALEHTIAADCLLAVCETADEYHLPILADLLSLRERMWGRLLDHSRAERLHVSEAEYPSHMADPVPADQVGRLIRNREWQQEVWTPLPDMQADLEEADRICNNLITFVAHMRIRHQFGTDIDWHLRLFDDIESTVSLGAQPFLRTLVAAYLETRAAKYAEHAARILWSFYRLSPLPNHRQGQGPWRTLEVGNRQANTWPAVTAAFCQTEAFDEATHAMLARSRFEHMRYLLAYCAGVGNWFQVESAGLAVAALLSPELRLADAYLRIALRRLKWINSQAYFDDGFQFELSHLYHMFPTSSMFAVLPAAKARGMALPEDFVALMEKAHEMYLYSMMPNRVMPIFNDNGPSYVNPTPLLRAASRVFDRPDYLWGGTRGKEGRAPDHTSHAWPHTGYYVMRDKWGEDGQCLYFDGAPYGAGHQHEDKLNFVLHSHGRLLIGDPAIYSYANTELTHYFRSSRGHNVVLIDGKGQARRLRPAARLTTLGENEWVSGAAFDFVSSEYKEGFAPDAFGRRGMAEEVNHSFSHRRAIFYVKPEYWILCDLIRGEDDDAHKLEQIFHIAPVHEPDAPTPMRAGEVSASASAIVTQDPGLGNLAILPVDPDGLDVRAQKGETTPATGWYGVLGEFPAWDITLERHTALPARMDAVLFPMAPGEDKRPTVSRLIADERVTAFRITGDDIVDTFVLCEEGSGPVQVEDVSFEGRALLLRRSPEPRALAVDAVSVLLNGKEMALES